jgi:hypothetical protein
MKTLEEMALKMKACALRKDNEPCHRKCRKKLKPKGEDIRKNKALKCRHLRT